MPPQNPSNPALDYYNKKYGVQQNPSTNPALDYYTKKYGSSGQLEEEDLEPANDGIYGWLGNVGKGLSSTLDQIKQGANLATATPGAPGVLLGNKIWNSVKTSDMYSYFKDPMIIAGPDGKAMLNPESQIVKKLTNKVTDEAQVPGFTDQFSQIFKDPDGVTVGMAKFAGDLGSGLYQQMVTDPLTAVSGFKPDNKGNAVPATDVEQYQAIKNTASVAVMMGVAGAVSKGILAKVGTDADLLPTLSTKLADVRVGRLGKALGAEATGMLAGGVAGSIVKNEDVTLKSAADMVLSPASIVFTALGAAGKLKELKTRQTVLELERTAKMGNASAEYVAANTITASINSTPAEIASSVSKLASTDDLVKAAVEARLEVGSGFLVPNLSDAGHYALYNHYLYDGNARNPAPDISISKSADKATIKNKQFVSNFDKSAYRLGATKSEAVARTLLKEIAAATGLDEAAIKSHASYMQEVVAKSIPNEFGKILVDQQTFKPYHGRTEVQPYIYRGPNQETYVAPGELPKAQAEHFIKTGFFPQEVVSVSGKDAILKKWNNTYSVVDFGMGDKRVSTKNLVRKVSDDLTSHVRALSDPGNPMAPKAGMELGVLTPESFMNKIYGEFRASLNGEYDSFQENFFHHMDKNNIPKSDRARVQQYFYKKLGDEAFLSHAPEEQYILKESQAALEQMHDNVLKNEYNSVAHTAFSNGMYFEQDSNGYVLKDNRTGKPIKTFSTLTELRDFAKNSGQGETVSVDGGGTGKGDPAVARVGPQVPWYVTAGSKSFIGGVLIPVRKQIEWLGVDTGDPAIGARLQSVANNGGLKYAAFITHEAFGLNKMHEQVLKMGLSETESANVARLLNARSLEDLRSDITPEQAQYAESVVKRVNIEDAKEVILRSLKDSPADFQEWIKRKSIDPQVVKVAMELKDMSKAGEINHNVMRYATALANPDAALSVADLRVKLQQAGEWTEKLGKAEKIARDFFTEGARVFRIPEENFINDYLPVMLDYGKEAPMISNKWIKNSGMAEKFVHELQRAGWTPTEKSIHDIESIMHKYLVTGARVASGMSDDINTALKMKEEWVKGLQDSGIERYTSSANLVNRTVDEWIESIKNVPSPSEQAMRGSGVKIAGKLANLTADWFGVAFLSARPVMAAYDAASTMILSSSKYGFGLFAGMNKALLRGDFNDRIRSLEARGKIPQFSASAILSRPEGQTTIISKAADFGIKLSLQEQAYKVSFGTTYLATLDMVESAINNAKGNKARIYHDLGDVLEGNNPAVIARFKEMVSAGNLNTSAAEFLALSNAGSVANMFGKMNNPLKWQNSVGRLAGQFGSWGANAGTSLVEMYAMKDWKYMARASARMTITNGVVLAVATGLGIAPAKFMVHPASVLPKIGPAYSMYDDLVSGLNSVIGSEDESNYGQGRLERILKNNAIPLATKNAYAAWELYSDYDNKYQAFMKLMGFKVVDQ